MSTTHVPSQFKVLLMATPAHNLLTMGTVSNGDNVGLNLNPLSGMVMGPDRHLLGSFKLFMGGLPATKMLNPDGQNGLSPGAFGLTIVPSQFKTISLT
ncbi:MAG: PAAR-like domain-containing protein, partial [Gammaproteobacteria bacterium]